MKTEDLAEKLSQAAAFAEFDPAELRLLAASMEVAAFDDGETIVREGDAPDGCWVLLEGRVRIDHDHDGESVALDDLEAGEVFGLVGLLDHRAHAASCRAVGRTRCARLRAEPFNLLHEASPEVALHVQRMAARQLARDTRALNEALVASMLGRRSAASGARLSGGFHLNAG